MPTNKRGRSSRGRQSLTSQSHVNGQTMASTGTPQSTQNTPQNGVTSMRKPAQECIAFWTQMDKNKTFEEGFQVELKSPGKKRKRQDALSEGEVNYEYQHTPYKNTTVGNCHYRVSPNNIWEEYTKTYKKFAVGQGAEQVTMAAGDYVYIKPDKVLADTAVRYWVAKVLEVRAGDEKHVFLRVFWMYRPEDLSTGRQPYHGENELIASNAMEVIDALSVDGVAEVSYWDEQQENEVELDPSKLFYRQTVGFSGKYSKFSALRKFCIENTPCNPDEGVIQCEHCFCWLHVPCLEADAMKNAGAAVRSSTPELDENTANDTDAASASAHAANSAKRRASGVETPNAATLSQTDKEPTLNRHIDADSASEDVLEIRAELRTLENGKSVMTIIDNRLGYKQAFRVPIVCLKCHNIIDPNDDGDDVDGTAGVAVADSADGSEDVIQVEDVDDAGGIIPETSSAIANDQQVSKMGKIDQRDEDKKEIDAGLENTDTDDQAVDDADEATPSRPPASSWLPSIAPRLRMRPSSETIVPTPAKQSLRPVESPRTPKTTRPGLSKTPRSKRSAGNPKFENRIGEVVE